MKSIGLFGAAAFCVFVIACAVSVYGYGQFEHAWGRTGSFQVEVWLAIVGALIAMGSFGISSAALHRLHSLVGSFALGAVCSIAYIFLYWLITDVAPAISTNAFVPFLLLIAISFCASFAGQKYAG